MTDSVTWMVPERTVLIGMTQSVQSKTKVTQIKIAKAKTLFTFRVIITVPPSFTSSNLHTLTRLLMQSPQPTIIPPPPNPLTPRQENTHRQIIDRQNRTKRTSNNLRIPMLQNPIQQINPHSETDGLFT